MEGARSIRDSAQAGAKSLKEFVTGESGMKGIYAWEDEQRRQRDAYREQQQAYRDADMKRLTDLIEKGPKNEKE